MSKPTTYLAVTNPIKITTAGRHFGKMARYAVTESTWDSGVVSWKEIQNPETGEWVRTHDWSACPVLASAIMQGAS